MRSPISAARAHLSALLLALVLTTAAAACRAQTDAKPFVSPVFGSNMVLQRRMPVPVWGWAQPDAKIAVSIEGRSATATAGADGKWMAKLAPLPVGGPYKMRIEGAQKTVMFDNVLVGDVWVCSGQSNMEFGIGNGKDAQKEIAEANYPQIRLFTVAKKVAYEPQATVETRDKDLMGQWSVCTPETVKTGGWNGFSAVGYFFGRQLHQDLKVPIGLIHSSWGGTIAEAWTSAEALQAMPDFRASLEKVAATHATPATGKQDNNPNVVTVLYDGMIAPLIPYAIKGAIWYQGESNAGRAFQYRTLLPTMIKDWRTRWGEGDFPFFIVQLANWQKSADEPKDDAWAELREAQSMTARDVPKVGIAVTIDVGDAADIHPKDKQTVGKRLALAAEAIAYGRRVEYSGPLYKSMSPANNGAAIRLNFDHAEGLTAKGDKLTGFAIAGEDRKFVWADAKIEGRSVVVSSPQVPHPVAVRYAWHINPVCDLYNGAGLPASPFRTDDWPGITVNNK
ncbi:MAG TPA: sialate O-acetylesterase [Chthonomonadaceae bacterium]|nr:sialate O-acetylesterase [Chthonomonadaceae bacterium]